MKRILIGTAAVWVAAVTAGFAAPMERKDVTTDPALLAHVDVDALKNTSVGKAILADPDVQTKLDGVEAAFNFDLRKDLHGFTIYTTTEHSQAPALIVYADFDPDRLVKLAKTFPGYEAETNGGRVLHSWNNDKKNDDDSPRIHAAIAGHRVVFGKSKDALTHALDVIEGKADSLKDAKLLLPKKDGDLVVIEGCLHKFDVGDNNPASAVFQQSKTVRFQLAESGEKVGAKVSFQAKDEDAATQVAAMVNGLLALVKIQQDKGDPNLIKLANAIEVKQDGATVTLGLSEPSAELIQMIKKGAEEKKHKEGAVDTNAPATKT